MTWDTLARLLVSWALVGLVVAFVTDHPAKWFRE